MKIIKCLMPQGSKNIFSSESTTFRCYSFYIVVLMGVDFS